MQFLPACSLLCAHGIWRTRLDVFEHTSPPPPHTTRICWLHGHCRLARCVLRTCSVGISTRRSRAAQVVTVPGVQIELVDDSRTLLFRMTPERASRLKSVIHSCLQPAYMLYMLPLNCQQFSPVGAHHTCLAVVRGYDLGPSLSHAPWCYCRLQNVTYPCAWSWPARVSFCVLGPARASLHRVLLFIGGTFGNPPLPPEKQNTDKQHSVYPAGKTEKKLWDTPQNNPKIVDATRLCFSLRRSTMRVFRAAQDELDLQVELDWQEVVDGIRSRQKLLVGGSPEL